MIQWLFLWFNDYFYDINMEMKNKLQEPTNLVQLVALIVEAAWAATPFLKRREAPLCPGKI
jgi:hypothetical protein